MLLFLLESAAWASDPKVGFTMTDIWTHSGYLARSVIFTLGLMMVVAIIVSIERMIAFSKARTQSMQLAAQIVGPLQQGDIKRALVVAGSENFKSAYLGAVLRAGLGELEQRLDEYGVANAKRAVDKAMNEEISKARRGMSILATVGSTAPFVGLFGTTFGVINAFQGMATAGSGLAAISAGISEALITTGVGIGVAVVGVWLFNYFNGRIEKVTDELISSEADFMDWAHKQLQPPPDPAAGK